LAQQGHPAQSKTLARLGKCQIALGQIDSAALTLLSAREACTEPATLTGIQADLAKIERVKNHLKSADRAREGSNFGMQAFAIEQASKEVETVPMAWRVQKLQALIGKKAYDEAGFYATDIVRASPSNVGFVVSC
jgi:DnaJ family protein C protein 7